MSNVALILNNLNEFKNTTSIIKNIKKKNKVYFFVEADKSRKKKIVLNSKSKSCKKICYKSTFFFFSNLDKFSDLVDKYSIKNIFTKSTKLLFML